jgi:hypothetical protein
MVFGRCTAEAIADLLRGMKGFIDEVDGEDWTVPPPYIVRYCYRASARAYFARRS